MSAFRPFVLLALLSVPIVNAGSEPQETAASLPSEERVYRVYSHLFDPLEHPDKERRPVASPSWETFGNRTQFTTLRGFGMEGSKITGFVEALEQYTTTHRLGNVIWPSYPILFADNLDELADEIKKRGLFLFDIWGYVPGSGPGGYWMQYQAPEDVFELLESRLGNQWLGMDVGEQDGRYIGGYAGQMSPVSADRFEQYLNFQRHFEHIGNELGNKLCTLVSLNFGHYFLKEGTYTTIGAETAQALPNSQVYYAFIRGAGKQYGVSWFGNASVWNRWGWKSYAGTGDDHSPEKGTSLNLLKRLLYTHILYNCMFVGFESGWFDGENQLSPIGRIQQAAQQWVLENGQPGTMITPVAFMLDFFSGWSFPRHLYTSNVYRVWGNLPYEEGDYLTDALLDMFYPGYQDASYFHNESGFMTPTPYGDSVDCLLSDAPGWLLARYPVLVLAGDCAASAELHKKLTDYVEQGGCLVITGANLGCYPNGIGGIQVVKGESPAGETDGLIVPSEGQILAMSDGVPTAAEVHAGRGSVIAFSSPFGLQKNNETDATIKNEVDASLYKPMQLQIAVKNILDEVFRREVLFDVGPELSLVTCRKEPGLYTLAIANNSLTEKPLHITSNCGTIEDIHELPLDMSEKGAPGYLPEGFSEASVGESTDVTISGGDIRIFLVRVREENVEEIPHVAPPPRPGNRALPLRGHIPIKEQVLARPTFFEHFDGVVADWRYVYDRDETTLQQESGWLQRQGLRLWIDFSSGINLYPDLRLVNNDEGPYAESMDIVKSVFSKMAAWGAHDAVLCLHRVPENNITREATLDSFEESLGKLSAEAATCGITLYLRTSTKDDLALKQMQEMVTRIGASNLKFALDMALLLDQSWTPDKLAQTTGSNVDLWIADAPKYDVAGKLWTTSSPVAQYEHPEKICALRAIAPDVPVLLNAVYADKDEEYLDALVLDCDSPESGFP